MWTKFSDMYSGGREKLGATTIWVEAAYDEAVALFEQIFDRDPHNVTCGCCGPDYYADECDPKIQSGDWVVSATDIERFRGGHALPANVELKGGRDEQ